MNSTGFQEYLRDGIPKIEYTLRIKPEDYGFATAIIESRLKESPIGLGIKYSFSIEKGSDSGEFRLYSTFLHPDDETKMAISKAIRGLGDEILEYTNNLKSHLLRSKHNYDFAPF
ncbi:hypothetical protein M1583_02485 [Candidatus Marsarchaeota archaeon]|nr:hypothetical protein [Candidatus Marsarchaeota archaeon]